MIATNIMSFTFLSLCLALSLISTLFVATDGFSVTHGGQRSRKLLPLFAVDRRRAVADIMIIGASTTLLPLPSQAGEVGARITKAVTTSDIGISVRTSVVKGAQTMDQIDRQWEEFSDRFSLGSERANQAGRPKKKVIPPLKPLDSSLAMSMLESCDSVFCDVTGLSPTLLDKEVETVNQLVRPSFERSGSNLSDLSKLENQEQFNYASYVHFKAYGNLLVDKRIDFRTFRPAFEQRLGEKMLRLFSMVPPKATTSDNRKSTLEAKLAAVDTLTALLCEKGLVAATDMSPLSSDQIEDWADDLSDLQLSLALDGDATTNAQILLQEQGFNLIPSYAKFMIRPLLQLDGQQLSMEEYYMDTDYNTNPDLFEVKEVLLNIILDST